MTLWSVFAGVVERFPDRPAVEVQRAHALERFTYRELHALATMWSAWLVSRGVRRGERCAILADNDAHWCGAYLGTLRAGAVAVPLDTNYAAAQVATIVADAGARVLFANTRLRPTAEAAVAGLSGIELADVHEVPVAPAGPAATSAPGEAAVILYTSGTTADPKGVVLTHANLIAERDAAFQIVAVTEHDSVLGVLPLFHALAQLANLLLPFAVGARVVFLETVSSVELLRALAERRITIFACVPQFFYLIHQRLQKEIARSGGVGRTMFRLLLALSFRLRRLGLNAGPRLFRRVHALIGPEMRLFITGGSKFDPAIGRDFYSLGFTILQAYGLTETSGACTLTRPDEAYLDTVGRALPGQEIRIIPDARTSPDRPGPPDLRDLPDGEIAVRGPVVMQGYFNRSDATAAVLRDGWFLTGDLGRLDAEGRLTITGRKKEVIVLASGKNIYPEEIERHYRQSPFVKEICVMGLARAGEPTTERLHAVIHPDPDLLRERRIANAGDLLRFEIEGLAIGLPAHKRVLSFDIWFEPLPKTTTGKLKRHEIQRRVIEKHASQAQPVSSTMSESDAAWLADPAVAPLVAVVRAHAASGARIVPDANLELDLGLDSMERVELLTDIEQQCGVTVSTDEAHEIFSLRQLVDAVRSRASRLPVAHQPPDASDDSWSVIFRDLPPGSDPVLGHLLRRRMVTPLLFVMVRLVRLLLVRVRADGLAHLPARGPFLICPNHQGFLDPFLLCSVLPYRVFKDLFAVGAAEYFQTPLTAWAARQINVVPVDPDASLIPAMKAGAFGLSHGKILLLFPEGERSIDGTVKRFKKGAPILARHLGVPMAPVAIRGAFELWPRNRPLQWRLLLPWSGHRVHVRVGAPITASPDRSIGELTADLRADVVALWDAAPGAPTSSAAAVPDRPARPGT